MEKVKNYIAEAIGTCCLVLFACGTAVLSGEYLATALAFGVVLILVALTVCKESGCHINPAVSLAMLIRGKMSVADFVGYICGQFLGGIVGTALLGLFVIRGQFRLLGGNEISGALMNAQGDLNAWSYIGAFLVEVVLTCVFVYVILTVTDSRHYEGKYPVLFIGLALTVVHLLGMGLTGTSVNPARSFGPSLLQGFGGNWTSFSQIWIWLLAPLAGGALAAILYGIVNKDGAVAIQKSESKPAAEPKAEEPKEEEVKEEKEEETVKEQE